MNFLLTFHKANNRQECFKSKRTGIRSAMDEQCKKYRFINSQTGNTLYYHSVEEDLDDAQLHEQLDKVKAQVAIQNGLFVDIVYWEEIKA